MEQDYKPKIQLPHINRSPKPILINRPDKPSWSFSFKYFEQKRFFGLKNKDGGWFVSIFEQLRDYCKVDIEKFQSDLKMQNGFRYHKIDWHGKNVPMERADFNWIDKDILENEDEFPFYQIHISKALGRIVGLWGLNNIFYILLLDPEHNIQPSKYNDYKVTKTAIQDSNYTSLMIDIDKLKKHQCATPCKLREELNNIPSNNNTSFYSFELHDDYYEAFHEKIKDKSITELIELGLLHI
ncbi:hypothetical protein [Epilithonimonas vandammei]|uniref:Uncharacterized protein n=1 Tax=Epilithonimonas vandammei TaxID=2487072 RepID=A0A3G8YCA6_9FLAO|nr:hypothetical protein [Epilithonimonas vandammei]AZI38536.1 hypothetical protein EIB74_00520 [Epilithonimonas vandammei]